MQNTKLFDNLYVNFFSKYNAGRGKLGAHYEAEEGWVRLIHWAVY